MSSSCAVVVIDVQKCFVDAAANPDIHKVLGNIQQVFEESSRLRLPFLLTFERSMEGKFALAEGLKDSLPAQTQSFVKTTFDATSLSTFLAAAENSGQVHFILAGSETDVCVLQTALGLRAEGYAVTLLEDAIFSSDPNTGPALRRLREAGVGFAKVAELDAISKKPPPSLSGKNSIVLPFLGDSPNVAFVMEQADRLSAQKLERFQQLQWLAEWMEIPIFWKGEMPAKPEGLEGRRWQSLGKVPEQYQQLFLAGQDPAALAMNLGHRQLYIVEDASADSLPKAIPLTYKTLYHDLKKSIAEHEWPSPSWAQRFDSIHSKMKEPEHLTPIRP